MKKFKVTKAHLKLLSPSLTLALNPNCLEDEPKIVAHVRKVLDVELLEERCLAIYEEAQIARRVSMGSGTPLVGTYRAENNTNNWKWAKK